MGKLDGKVAIVTGGSSGLGKATVMLFAREGAKVIVNGASDQGAAVAQKIIDDGGEAIFVKADVSVPEDAERMVRTAVQTFGKLDVLLNNAGILGPRGAFCTDITSEQAQKMIDVNFKGVFFPTKYAVPEMIKARGGVILTTGSDSAYIAHRGHSVYSGTKAAAIAFTRVIAMEYAEHNIRANTISPSASTTPMHEEVIEGDKEAWAAMESLIPMGRACHPDDFAKTALFFASDDAKYLTAANLMIDGGFTAKGF